jgi:hypothetical protein
MGSIDYMAIIGCPSTHLVNILLANNDPRLEEWIDPIAGTNHLGLQPGLALDQMENQRIILEELKIILY